MLRRFTLPIKFSLFSLLMTLTGVAIALSVAFYQSDSLLRQQALERLSDDLQREQAILNNKLGTLVDDVRFVSDSAAVAGIVRASMGGGYDDQENMTQEMWQGRLIELFKTVLQQRHAYTQIRLIAVKPEGKELVRVDRVGEGLLQMPDALLQVKAEHAYFQKAVRLPAGELYISPVTLNREHGRIVYPPQPVLRIATPIYGPGGVYGVAVINADFDRLLGALYKAPEHIQYFLTNTEGEYLIHPDPDRRMAFDRGPGYHGSVFEDFSSLNEALTGYWQSIQQYLPESRQGVVMLRSFFDSGHQGGVEFWLGARAELALLRTQSDELKEQIYLLALIIVLGVTLGTVLMGRYITRPILGLKQAADRISSGERDVYLDTRGYDEVASLAQSLQTMLEHLGSSRNDLAELNRSLEDKVSLRTLELENTKAALEAGNEELARALAEAEQAAVAKSQFLANMSHEIRTPLNGVLGMAELLMNTSLDERQLSYLDTVKTSGNTLLNLLNDILDFSKLEAGKLNLSELKFNPNDVVEHSLQLFVELAHSKGLELIPVTLPALPNLMVGDPDRLGQVLMNLVSNAIKFTEHGEVVLSVDCVEEHTDSMKLRFSVQDTGIGISLDQQQKLFEKFVQADGTSTRRHGGTGLGLAISKQLVNLMGGDIQLQSTPGEGTLIWFDVELAKGPVQKVESDAQALIQGKRVLVVDDNKTNRELLHQMVRSWGMHSSRAADASTAFHHLIDAAERGAPVDLILLDHMMPGQNGLSLACEVSQHPLLQKPRVILLTSISDQLSADELSTCGICSMMTKPLRQSQLYNQIVHCIEEPSASPFDNRITEPATPDATQVMEGESRILLVEDTPLNQRVAEGMLSTLGYKADLVCNGQQAVDQVCGADYQLVLMDVEMPIKDGLQATREIRDYEQQHGLAATPIVALTAHALKGDREKCLKAGMSDYLTKPLTMDSLRNCLQRWLAPAGTGTGCAESRQEARGLERTIEPVTTESDTDVVLDEQVLEQLRLGLGDDIDDVLQLFLLEWPELLTGLQYHLDQNEREQLRTLAHRLKGSCRNLGATRVAQAAMELELGAPSAEIDVLQATIDQLKQFDSSLVYAVKSHFSEVDKLP